MSDDAAVTTLCERIRKLENELGAAQRELSFLREKYGDTEPEGLTRDALLLQARVLSRERDVALAEIKRLCDERDTRAEGAEVLMRSLDRALRQRQELETCLNMALPLVGIAPAALDGVERYKEARRRGWDALSEIATEARKFQP